MSEITTLGERVLWKAVSPRGQRGLTLGMNILGNWMVKLNFHSFIHWFNMAFKFFVI